MHKWLAHGRAVCARTEGTFLWRVLQRYLDDNLPNWAAAVAYHSLFALFPLLLALVTLVGLVLRDPARLDQLTQQIVQFFPAEVAVPLLATLQGTQAHLELLSFVSLGGLIYGGSALFGSLETAFNAVYRVPNRGFLEQKLMATGMLILFTVLLLLALGTASLATLVGTASRQVLAHVGENLPALATGGPLASAVGWLLTLGWAFLLFAVVYWIVPNRRFTRAEIWPGAFAAALLFLAITQLFPLYLLTLGRVNQYGTAFALTFLLLTWTYFLSHILLVGVTINAVLESPAPAEVRARTSAASATPDASPAEVQRAGMVKVPPEPVVE